MPPACRTARRAARSTASRRDDLLAVPRRASPGVRPLEPDSVHGSRLVQQVVNKVMADGKKSLAERIVYDALEVLSRRTGQPPVEALESSIKALTPVLEVRSRRGRGAAFPGPGDVPAPRAPPP